MKLGITSSLSIAGVLAAGAAAFALNTAVLSDSAPMATSNLVANAAATGDTVAPDLAGSVSAAGDAQVTTNSTKVSATSTTYSVGTAGSVIIDTSTGAVVVTDVIPATGWTAEPARTEPNGLVKVHFTKGTTRLEFSASIVNGSVNVNTISESAPPALSGGTGAKPSIPSAIGGGDDDDDDHHGGGNHEEEHDDDHEDGHDEDDD